MTGIIVVGVVLAVVIFFRSTSSIGENESSEDRDRRFNQEWARFQSMSPSVQMERQVDLGNKQ